MPKAITADEYELLLEDNCKALREYIARLERQEDGMNSTTHRIVSRLLESESKLKTAERALKEELERDRKALVSALADALAICRAHGLQSQIVHLDAISVGFNPNQRREHTALGARWN